MATKANSASSERVPETRQRILDAALSEFAANGLAGARTEAIAATAGVNKALLYYYFDSKEKLYLATLEMISARVRDNTMAVFFHEGTAGERILRSALNHFDRILTQHEFQKLMQQEMIRLHRGESDAIQVLVKRVFEPVLIMFQSMIREGISSEEIIDVDWLQVQLSSFGANVFYFLSAPVWRVLLNEDPLTVEKLMSRRRILLDYLGQTIFVDRQHGAELAAKVYADTPIPEISGHFLGRKM